MNAEEHEAAARRLDKQKEESFERSDTDGFLSQWAAGLSAELHRRQAQVERDGGVAEFPALYDLQGNRAPAKLITTRFGRTWAFFDEQGNFTGKFLSAFPARQSTLERKGYREGKEKAPAEAKIQGRGHGLSGSAWVAVVRKDRGY